MFKGIADTTIGTYASVLFWAIVLTAIIVWTVNTVSDAIRPEPAATEEPCTLIGQSQHGEPLTIQEDSAGKYRYELYATSGGVLIYKCDN